MDDRELQVLLKEYEQAQGVAQHSDAVFWQVASILWGANGVLLAFVLSAKLDRNTCWLFTDMVPCFGVLLSIFVLATHYSSKVGQRIAYKVCRNIEARLPTYTKLHVEIDRACPRGLVHKMIWVVSLAFVAAWMVVGWGGHRFSAPSVLWAAVVFGALPLVLWAWGRRRSRRERTAQR
jgi:membrane associated rhomboid family serine protease